MRLSAQQVMDKLGYNSRSPITRLEKEGKLTDISTSKEGRHHHIYDSKQVNDLAKGFKRLRGPKFNSNGNHPVELPGVTIVNQGPAILQRIERKLDQLIKMWS
jgi:hypothetical protein